MGIKKYSLTLIVGYVLISLLLGSTHSLSANYVSNPLFDKTCSSPTCTSTNFLGWQAYQHRIVYGAIPFRVVSQNSASISTATDKYWAELQSTSARGTCLYQGLSIPIAGTVTFSFDYYIKQNDNFLISLYEPTVANDPAGTENIDLQNTVFTVNTLNARTKDSRQVDIASARSKYILRICDDFDNGHTPFVTNVFLGKDCDDATQIVVKMAGGTQMCAPKTNDPNCLYTYSSPTFTCAGCIGSLAKINVNIGGVSTQRCAVSSAEIQTDCTLYEEIGASVRSCKTCPSGLLLPGPNNIKVCMATFINDCLVYNTDKTCKECSSGAPYDSTSKKCPSIPNCLRVLKQGAQYFCIFCATDYFLESPKICSKRVDSCAFYENGLCLLCIEGFFPKDNVCVRQSSTCELKDSTGACIKCSKGSSVKNGVCVLDQVSTICSSDQFIGFEGFCVNGNVENCAGYLSPSGQCSICKDGFKLTDTKQCISICPKAESGFKYLIVSRRCVLTDGECLKANDDGSCPICNKGFYSSSGKCIKHGEQPQGFEQASSNGFDEFLRDENNFSYFLLSNGGRFYITGPWKGKQVWVGDDGFLYQNTKTFLNGPYEGQTAFVDQNGNWFIKKAGGQILYLTGKNAKPVRLLQREG